MGLKFSIIGLDAPESIEMISKLSFLTGYESAGHTKNAQNILDVILSRSPDIIFLNVDNYVDNDFREVITLINDLFKSLNQKPRLIALATTEKQAYDCIKYNFFYYLLRPTSQLQLQKLDYKIKAAIKPHIKFPTKLCLQTYSDYQFIEIENILFLKADNNTTEFVMLDETKIIAFKTLKHFESVMPKSFSRIHQSFIINQKYISRIHLGKSECQLKPRKIRLPFSKPYKNVMSELATSLLSNSVS